MSYHLWHRPGVPQRGEFARLAPEAGGIAYTDLGREEGAGAIVGDMDSSGAQLLGSNWSYVDLSLFHLIEGLRHAFVRRMAALEGELGGRREFASRVPDLAELGAYLAREHRVAFKEGGLFRHYPEPDGD